jgi:hypothetical protein
MGPDIERLQELSAIEDAVWAELTLAPHHRSHEWRVGVLATVDGDAADARSVVLRDFETQTRTLPIYADSRSPKAAQIETHPLGTLVLWSEPLGWQVRLRVALSLETTGLRVSSRWARLKMTPGAHDYLSPLPPGSPLDRPARPHPQRDSREHFALLSAQILAVDWLELHADGHRRASFNAKGRRWLTP